MFCKLSVRFLTVPFKKKASLNISDSLFSEVSSRFELE